QLPDLTIIHLTGLHSSVNQHRLFRRVSGVAALGVLVLSEGLVWVAGGARTGPDAPGGGGQVVLFVGSSSNGFLFFSKVRGRKGRPWRPGATPLAGQDAVFTNCAKFTPISAPRRGDFGNLGNLCNPRMVERCIQKW